MIYDLMERAALRLEAWANKADAATDKTLPWLSVGASMLAGVAGFWVQATYLVGLACFWALICRPRATVTIHGHDCLNTTPCNGEHDFAEWSTPYPSAEPRTLLQIRVCRVCASTQRRVALPPERAP